ncbi:protein of unknown function [Candidatus Nitrosocosmicus franklandus]|uniref:Uncharacterized protein n=1 Tax=Candidatus Nitrosocosmicus franklandianus TaxID=1798806 RepID=A0A484I706_9ARCH|nr:protein of unknown function [Candidatus Nitrosocosmicus franklandus]
MTVLVSVTTTLLNKAFAQTSVKEIVIRPDSFKIQIVSTIV